MPELEHEHSAEAIAERISSVKHNYIRDWIYGGIDGAVTTFAVVSSVAGAELSPVIVLILGFANLVADGFSMAASNFLGTRAEQEDYKRIEEIEYRHIRVNPEGEREEIRQIYRDKGFAGDELEKAVDLITSDKDRWVQTMLTEEYGLPTEIRSAWKAALSTFTAFVICGLVPLVPYLFGVKNSFYVSSALTGATFFIIGSVKSRWSTASWLRSGLETFFVGALAAILAYAVGVLLKGMA
ncbi:MAG TPA: VIT1/CCC1 transporter family protein [Pyrinomonadaceae bacterium]|jgi:VIT1/CCC1 family predicted Fe2+/Mn2+ transporter